MPDSGKNDGFPDDRFFDFPRKFSDNEPLKVEDPSQNSGPDGPWERAKQEMDLVQGSQIHGKLKQVGTTGARFS